MQARLSPVHMTVILDMIQAKELWGFLATQNATITIIVQNK